MPWVIKSYAITKVVKNNKRLAEKNKTSAPSNAPFIAAAASQHPPTV
jgi:hypothetical protein